MASVRDVSSEEELLQLCNEGKISESDYQELLATMRRPAPDENVDERVWRSGNILVMHRNAVLPDRCVKTNARAGGRRLRRKLYWHHPALYLVILVNILIYAIVAIVVRKKATIEIGVSKETLTKRRNAIAITWIMVLGGIGLFVYGLTGLPSSSFAYLMASGFVVFLAGLIWAAVKVSLVTPTRIETDYIWIKGVSRQYLALLPEWEKR